MTLHEFETGENHVSPAAHFTQSELDRYRQRALSPKDLIAMNEHIANCDACHQQLGGDSRLASTVAFLQANLALADTEESEHVDAEEIAIYLYGTPNEVDRALVESHLEICPECAAIRQKLQHERPAVAASALAPQGIASRLREAARRWQAPAFRMSLKIAAVGLAVALFILAAVFLSRRHTKALRDDISGLPQQKQGLPVPTPPLKQEESLRRQTPSQNAPPQVAVPPTAQPPVLVVIKDGERSVSLNARGWLTGVEGLSFQERNAVRDALRSGQVRLSSEISKLNGASGRLMTGEKESTAFSLIGPAGTAVSSNPPRLRWRPLLNATSYTVIVYDRNLKAVASSPPLTETEWTPAPLSRGQTYSWQVRAIKEGREIVAPSPDAPDAKFAILSISSLRRLDDTRRRHANSPLTLGILYARAGLLEEAAAEFERLREANPDSALAEKLFLSVRRLLSPAPGRYLPSPTTTKPPQ